MCTRQVRAAFLVALLVFALSLLEGAALQTDRSGSVAFVHVTVIDGTGAAARPDQTVLVSGDSIAETGPSRLVSIPRGTRVIDGTGRFLIPGLWDSHVHTRYEGIDHLRLLIANGITSARNMSGPWEHLLEIHNWREQVAKGNRVGPRLLTAGPILDGPGSGRPDTVITVNSPEEGRDAVRRIKDKGADFVKVYNLLSRESFFAIVAEARAQQLPVAGHVPYAISAGEASDAGQHSIEHLDGILWASSTKEDAIGKQIADWRPTPGSVPGTRAPVSPTLLRDSFSTDKLRALAERLKRNQTIVVPTLALYWNRFEQRSDHSILKSPDRLRYVPTAYLHLWNERKGPETEEEARLQFEQCLIVVRELHRAGVTILAGTDVGISYQLPGFSLHDEISLLVKAGFSEMEALQAATRDPARAFNLSDMGTIKRGMRADLVLLDANPLVNIDNTRRIRTVVAAGRVFERGQLDTILSDIEKVSRQWAGSPTR
jgi:imidazolonepropionase-like amidohydrolase